MLNIIISFEGNRVRLSICTNDFIRISKVIKVVIQRHVVMTTPFVITFCNYGCGIL